MRQAKQGTEGWEVVIRYESFGGISSFRLKIWLHLLKYSLNLIINQIREAIEILMRWTMYVKLYIFYIDIT